jgi:hypothetical protein
MTAEDDVDPYLWDKSGTPDPEVRRLEVLLGRHRWKPGRSFAEARRRPSFRLAALVAAGLAVAAMIVWAIRRDVPAEGYRLVGVEGRDVVRAGEDFATGTAGARLEIGGIGHVDVEPNSRLQVSDCGPRGHRLFLEHGSVSARIWAPPRQFRIGSPAGETIDLGCAYKLDVTPDGLVSKLSVSTGQVAFEFDGREVYVPAGAACESVRGRGPAAPVFEAASAQFKDAVAKVEFGGEADPDAVGRMIALAERRDTLTLWHLFASKRSSPELQRAVFARLASEFPVKPEGGLTETGLLAGEPAMRSAWMDAMKSAWR